MIEHHHGRMIDLTAIGAWLAEIFSYYPHVVFQDPPSFVYRDHGQRLLPVGIVPVDVNGVVTRLAKRLFPVFSGYVVVEKINRFDLSATITSIN